MNSHNTPAVFDCVCAATLTALTAALLIACGGGRSKSVAENENPDTLHCFDLSTDRLPLPGIAGAGGASIGAMLSAATFEVTYLKPGDEDPYGQACEEFPEDARVAFDAATATWSGIIRSAVPIHISACWTDFRKVDKTLEKVTGVAAGMRAYRNFANAPQRNVCYFQSLANSLAGYDLDPLHPDMQISYNSGLIVPWYFGTDGKPGADQMDLMHVVTHEIGHGLGFRGSMVYDEIAGKGSWGVDGYPLVYDTAIVSGAGSKLLDYPDASTELGAQLVGNDIWFKGTHAYRANGDKDVKIYAPTVWQPGSSYVHLDEKTFFGTENELMIWTFNTGPETNTPGPVAIGILKDLGWTTAKP